MKNSTSTAFTSNNLPTDYQCGKKSEGRLSLKRVILLVGMSFLGLTSMAQVNGSSQTNNPIIQNTDKPAAPDKDNNVTVILQTVANVAPHLSSVSANRDIVAKWANSYPQEAAQFRKEMDNYLKNTDISKLSDRDVQVYNDLKTKLGIVNQL